MTRSFGDVRSYNGLRDYFRTIPMDELRSRIKSDGTERRPTRKFIPPRRILPPWQERIARLIADGLSAEQISKATSYEVDWIIQRWTEIRLKTGTKSVAQLRDFLREHGEAN